MFKTGDSTYETQNSNYSGDGTAALSGRYGSGPDRLNISVPLKPKMEPQLLVLKLLHLQLLLSGPSLPEPAIVALMFSPHCLSAHIQSLLKLISIRVKSRKAYCCQHW
jgi:hypothetical protein